jgi:hypothetical protein
MDSSRHGWGSCYIGRDGMIGLGGWMIGFVGGDGDGDGDGYVMGWVGMD